MNYLKLNEYIDLKKEVYQLILFFIENEDEEDFRNCYENIQEIEIFKDEENHDEFISLLRLILKISNNYHRSSNFDKKIEEILYYFSDEIKQTLSNFEIFNIFKNNKRILLFLIHKEIIIIDQTVLNFILSNESYCHFFYPEIKQFLKENEKQKEEEKLLTIDQDIFFTFDKKREIGENDSFICSLIREDKIEEFIQYINRLNISLSSHIKSSFFETNSFLINKEPSFIEYAAFFGSIQIFQYLKLNNVELTESLWLFVIHSRNAVLIHILEECNIELSNNFKENIFIESIKCHHNDIANYIKDNLINVNSTFSENIESSIFRFYNFSYFPDEFKQQIDFFYLCKYKHFKIVEFLLENTKKTVEQKMVTNIFVE